MRDILLTLLFAGLLPLALRHTWVGVLLYTWVSVMNPHRLTYGFAQNMPWAAVAAGATLISMLWNSRDLRLRAGLGTWLGEPLRRQPVGAGVLVHGGVCLLVRRHGHRQHPAARHDGRRAANDQRRMRVTSRTPPGMFMP